MNWQGYKFKLGSIDHIIIFDNSVTIRFKDETKTIEETFNTKAELNKAREEMHEIQKQLIKLHKPKE